MNGTISSCVQLAKAARGCLRRLGTVESLGDDQRIAPFAHAVWFEDGAAGDAAGRRRVADTSAEWLVMLGSSGATEAWVVHAAPETSAVAECVSAAFANGGGLWGVRVDGGDCNEIWIPQLLHVPDEDPVQPRWWWRIMGAGRAGRGRRPWRITFTRFPVEGPTQRPQPDIGGCASRLRTAIMHNRDFALRWKLKPWVKHFTEALAALDGQPSTGPEVPDVGPPGIFDEDADRLLRSAARAWCFGGMGTWNDIWVEDDDSQELHMRIASELYDALITAYQEATWPPVTR